MLQIRFDLVIAQRLDVVLERDPEKDIRALRNVRAVYFGGAPLQRQTLLSSNPGNWTPTFAFPAPNAPPDEASKAPVQR